tara:strand:- start:6569 stop:6715 length:147 start_codon:yes stop_codon:yes gene_type:complete
MTKKEIQKENEYLKVKVQEMERRIERLKARINGLQKVAALGRRGMPWR